MKDLAFWRTLVKIAMFQFAVFGMLALVKNDLPTAGVYAGLDAIALYLYFFKFSY